MLYLLWSLGGQFDTEALFYHLLSTEGVYYLQHYLPHSGVKSSSEGPFPISKNSASAPAQPGDTAQIISPFIFMNPDDLHCLSFWYHMNGTDVGSLQVFVRFSMNLKLDKYEKAFENPI